MFLVLDLLYLIVFKCYIFSGFNYKSFDFYVFIIFINIIVVLVLYFDGFILLRWIRWFLVGWLVK